MTFLYDAQYTRIMATRRRTPTPPTLNCRNQPAIDQLIRGYDLSKQIAESTRDYHRMHVYSAALTALMGQICHITEYQQAIRIDYIKEYFPPFYC